MSTGTRESKRERERESERAREQESERARELYLIHEMLKPWIWCHVCVGAITQQYRKEGVKEIRGMRGGGPRLREAALV
jgi:hypothetical protein